MKQQHNSSIRPNNSTTVLTNIDQTLPSSNNGQNPLTQDFSSEDPKLLSPDPAREVILRHSQNSQITQPVKNNNTTIQEEWIIPDEILPDEKWDLTSKSKSKTRLQDNAPLSNDINIAHHNKSILKATIPINFQFIEKRSTKIIHDS